jgi:hypothetical protein
VPIIMQAGSPEPCRGERPIRAFPEFRLRSRRGILPAALLARIDSGFVSTGRGFADIRTMNGSATVMIANSL